MKNLVRMLRDGTYSIRINKDKWTFWDGVRGIMRIFKHKESIQYHPNIKIEKNNVWGSKVIFARRNL